MRTFAGPLLLLGLLATACTPRRVVLPDAPTYSSLPCDMSGVALHIRSFVVNGMDKADTVEAVQSLQVMFSSYLQSRCRFREVVLGPRPPAAPALAMEVVAGVDLTRHRTWILDALFFWPLSGYWPLTPHWGDVKVKVNATALQDDKGPVWQAEHAAEEGYFMVAYSWYRTFPIERAYSAAFGQVFTQIADRLSSEREAILAAIAPAPAPARAADRATLAVLPSAGNVPPDILALVDDAVRDEMVTSGQFRVQDRAAMREVLATQQFNASEACDENCAVEQGRLLQVALLVTAVAKRTGDQTWISLRLTNVETGEVEGSVLDTCGDCDAATLVRTVQKAVRSLLVRARGRDG